MKRPIVGALFASLVVLGSALAVAAPESGWEAVDEVFGTTGKDLPGDVRRYGWPRTDLHVVVGDVAVEPGLALGTWAGFMKMGTGGEAVTMGDLVLLGPEVEPVLGELEAGGFEILAIHNHLIGEVPRVIYVHFHGHGKATALAKTLKAALAKTGTPPPGKAALAPTAAQLETFDKLQRALGRQGTIAGTVLQVSVARREPIREDGMEIPPSMGMNNPMNFQTVGTQVATTGDFVLVADEVNPVIRELHAHGIAATALHSHMLQETPKLFFMHFWGIGSPEEIGAGLKAAVAKIATK